MWKSELGGGCRAAVTVTFINNYKLNHWMCKAILIPFFPCRFLMWTCRDGIIYIQKAKCSFNMPELNPLNPIPGSTVDSTTWLEVQIHLMSFIKVTVWFSFVCNKFLYRKYQQCALAQHAVITWLLIRLRNHSPLFYSHLCKSLSREEGNPWSIYCIIM